MSQTNSRRPFLRADWRDLVMVNYEVSQELLAPLVPAGVELDRWGGTLYASVVGFLFRDTRVLGLPIPGHRTFQEVNLRFYVRREVDRETRRGVVFVREIVPRPAIAFVARTVYNEPYRAMPMRHRFARSGINGPLERQYSWQADGQWASVRARTDGPAQPLQPGSEEEFITEHYWGYTRQRDGSTIEYRVDHPRWNVWTALDGQVEGNVAAVYGEPFARVLTEPPRSAFVAEGSPVTVFKPTKIR